MTWLIPGNSQDRPRWLKRVFLFVGLPAWLGFGVLLASGTAFEHQKWTILFFGIFFGVCVLNAVGRTSVAVAGRFSPVLAAITIGVVAFGIGRFLLHEPAPEPANAWAFGCYASPSAPPIRLDNQGMQIVQYGLPRIAFHLERHKQGIALTADRPVYARPTPAGYRYAIADRGIGRFLDFYRLDRGQVSGVFEESELSGFRMLAEDGAYLPYDRADASRCAIQEM